MDQAMLLAKEFARFDTPSVSDAMDKLGIPCGLQGLRQVIPGTKLCGTAFTVHYVPCGVTKGTVGDFMEDVKPGQVVVIDNAGREYCTVWGDLMSIYASKHDIAGTVIDGVCRDIPVIRELNYPIFTKGFYMVTGKDRVQVDAVNVPVAIAGLQVKPDDILLGDDTGILVIPLERGKDVLRIAIEIAKKEESIAQSLRAGGSLREARAKVGYHNLQTRKA